MSEQEIDVKRLREVAEAATPGPWHAWDRGVGWMIALDEDANTFLPEGLRTDIARGEDAAHIAAFDPPTVLALLDRLEAAEALARKWSEHCDCEHDGYDDQQIEDGHALREALGLPDDCACRECEYQRNPPEPMEPLTPEQEAEFVRKMREHQERMTSVLGEALDKAFARREESK